MTLVRLFVLNACMLAAVCMAGGAENTWHGEYDFFASGGQTAGGSQIMMRIALRIGELAGEEKCQIDADGFQTNDRILCTTEINNDRLALRFKSYASGKTVNEIDVTVYKVGETLFSLERVAVKDRKKPIRYLAHWGTYTPFGVERKNVKDYFEKVK